jgi:DNA-binding response OmpR family regulator
MARVVIVDSSNQARALSAELRLQGYEVELFTEPRPALASMSEVPADVVLVDLMLPGTTGLAFSRLLRDKHPSTLVILTGAYQLSERQLLRADCGAVGFIPKPYGTHEVAAYLRTKVPASQPSMRARA